jgi:arsenate reductase
VIEELGVDAEQAFARPVTDEVLRAADVIVTMGHGVGVIDLPQHIRHDDWRVGDPIAAPIPEIRRVRAHIEYRVLALLSDLGIPTTQDRDINTTPQEPPTSQAALRT